MSNNGANSKKLVRMPWFCWKCAFYVITALVPIQPQLVLHQKDSTYSVTFICCAKLLVGLQLLHNWRTIRYKNTVFFAVSNTGDIEMALINPTTTSNQSRNQDASQDGVENGKGHEISKGNWGLFNSSRNEWKNFCPRLKRWLNQKQY